VRHAVRTGADKYGPSLPRSVRNRRSTRSARGAAGPDDLFLRAVLIYLSL